MIGTIVPYIPDLSASQNRELLHIHEKVAQAIKTLLVQERITIGSTERALETYNHLGELAKRLMGGDLKTQIQSLYGCYHGVESPYRDSPERKRPRRYTSILKRYLLILRFLRRYSPRDVIRYRRFVERHIMVSIEEGTPRNMALSALDIDLEITEKTVISSKPTGIFYLPVRYRTVTTLLRLYIGGLRVEGEVREDDSMEIRLKGRVFDLHGLRRKVSRLGRAGSIEKTVTVRGSSAFRAIYRLLRIPQGLTAHVRDALPPTTG